MSRLVYYMYYAALFASSFYALGYTAKVLVDVRPLNHI